jgi:hypothetical protein
MADTDELLQQAEKSRRLAACAYRKSNSHIQMVKSARNGSAQCGQRHEWSAATAHPC